jgi:uncharacterized protein (TIGR03066 family)
MNALKCLGLLALVVSFAANATAQDDKVDYKKLIVGKWEVSKADEGTVPTGTLIEFTKDGKLKIAAKMGDDEFKIDGTYKVVKNTFEFTLSLDGMEKSQTITITKISEKEMSTKNDEGKVVELKKQKK